MANRFDGLRTYVAILDAGGVNAAAATLGIARSAVSRRLSDLEARLRVTLVERSTRNFAPTDARQIVGEEARRLLTANVNERPVSGSVAAPLNGDY